MLIGLASSWHCLTVLIVMLCYCCCCNVQPEKEVLSYLHNQQPTHPHDMFECIQFCFHIFSISYYKLQGYRISCGKQKQVHVTFTMLCYPMLIIIVHVIPLKQYVYVCCVLFSLFLAQFKPQTSQPLCHSFGDLWALRVFLV